MRTIVSLAALALFSATASAASPLHEALTEKEGLAKIGDGLYASETMDGQSYVATNAAGRTALRARMLEDREMIGKHFAIDGLTRTERAALDDMDRSIAELSRSANSKRTDEETGLCGSTTIYARAVSNGGTSASSYSVASNANGPVAATTNFASVLTGITYQSTTTSGAAPASLSAANPNVCFATGFSTVTCPGESEADIWAYAVSSRIGSLACFFN